MIGWLLVLIRGVPHCMIGWDVVLIRGVPPLQVLVLTM